ncbi:MAG: type II toxin-antitoxin system HicA family toxin [Acidobacteria bacterium]|nr:type II toxin-antitoxin system HicA family toxin [Acidobacteriota bacterium]
MRCRDFERKLKNLGRYEVSTKTAGSHRKWINPKTNQGAAIPDWGSKDLKNGTLRGAIKQLGFSWDKFMAS